MTLLHTLVLNPDLSLKAFFFFFLQILGPHLTWRLMLTSRRSYDLASPGEKRVGLVNHIWIDFCRLSSFTWLKGCRLVRCFSGRFFPSKNLSKGAKSSSYLPANIAICGQNGTNLHSVHLWQQGNIIWPRSDECALCFEAPGGTTFNLISNQVSSVQARVQRDTAFAPFFDLRYRRLKIDPSAYTDPL